jgi:hypothetical protein
MLGVRECENDDETRISTSVVPRHLVVIPNNALYQLSAVAKAKSSILTYLVACVLRLPRTLVFPLGG